MTSAYWTTVHEVSMGECADTVEWCSVEPHRDVLACGTYQLLENKDRVGGITLLRVLEESVEHLDSIKSAAVLDMKWAAQRCHTKVMLAAATAAGQISLYELSNDKKLVSVSLCSLRQEPAGDLLVLAVAWSSDGDKIVASDSSGTISLVQFHDNHLQITVQWAAHTLEAWTVTFDVSNSHIIYTGGDDCKLCVWNVGREPPACIGNCSKHEAGVTSLHSQTSGYLVSGSYDEQVRLWDCRNWRSSVTSGTASGGIWRLKPGPGAEGMYYLAACVYGGAQVLSGLFADKKVDFIASYAQHESMCYGADWHSTNSLIATCSFYDKKLCISKWLPS